MSENKNRDINNYEECSVEVHTKNNVLKECKENGYGSIDITVVNVNEKPPLGKEEDSSITPEAIGEINTTNGKIKYVNGEEGAALGIDEAQTTEEIKAAKEAKKRAEEQDPEL